jgi:polyisoprenoid-binding protein YceI
VAGTIVIGGTTLNEAVIEADLSAIVTNESRRDRRVRGALSTDEFPLATFVLTEPIELGPGAADGEPVVADAVGELTIKGITQPVAIPIEAVLVDDLIVVVGSIDLVFADFDVEVPSAPVVLSAEDHGIMEMQLFLRKT